MMRHVSRTHRVALDGLFDRINLDTKVQINYVETKNQLAGLVSKVSFMRDECRNLFRLCNSSNFSMFSRSHFRSIEKANTMSKRIRERTTGEELAVAKPRSTCLISRIQLNEKQTSSIGSDASNVLENPQLRSEPVLGSTRKLVRNRD